MRLFGSLKELVKVSFRKNSQQIDLDPNQTTTYTADRVIELPQIDGDDVLISRTSSDTGTNRLKNKELDDATTAFVDDSGITRKMQFQLSGITGGTTRTLTVPDASGTLTLTALAQTLTNKSIDADTNTISNIDNNEIRAAAAIDATKIANGSVDNTEFQTLNGVGTAGAGNIVTTDGTQTLSNKTVDNTNTVTLKDTLFTIQDDGDTSKQLKFQASGITTATTRTLTAPDANTTIVGTDATQTLTNKSISGASNTVTNISLTTSVTGTLPIANGGTNGTTATTGFNNLAPTTTKGDLIAHDTTNNVRLAVGTDGQVLTASSAATSGVAWVTPSTSTPGTQTTDQTSGSITIDSGKTLLYPNLIVANGDVITVNGSLLGVNSIIVTSGTVIANGPVQITNWA